MTVERAKWGCLGLVVCVVWSVGGVAVAEGLSEAMRAHQYRLQARTALKEKDPQGAIRALEKFEKVTSERRWEFLYLYGTLLANYGTTSEDIRKGHDLLIEVVNKIGEEREPYFSSALEQLSVAEARLEALAEEAGRAEETKEAKEARRAEALRAGRRFRDCADCPEMVVVPAGTFMMGSEEGDSDERPVHRVTIAEPFAVGVYEVTRGQYARFVSTTGHSTGNSCWTHDDGKWKDRSGRGWKNPGFEQGETDPVVCVDWKDAQAYVRWLSEETGETYRLLSEAEWEYVARAGTRTARYWGESASGQCRHANGADQTAKRHNDGWTVAACDDGHYGTAPVGSFGANGYGLYDVLGNVWEWTQDCWHDSYQGAPADGGAWESGECSRRVLRGGSWIDDPWVLRSANRYRNTAGDRSFNIGFRLARTLTP